MAPPLPALPPYSLLSCVGNPSCWEGQIHYTRNIASRAGCVSPCQNHGKHTPCPLRPRKLVVVVRTNEQAVGRQGKQCRRLCHRARDFANSTALAGPEIMTDITSTTKSGTAVSCDKDTVAHERLSTATAVLSTGAVDPDDVLSISVTFGPCIGRQHRLSHFR